MSEIDPKIFSILFDHDHFPIFKPLSDLTERHAEAWGYKSLKRLIEKIRKQDVEYCVMLELF